jgi:ribose-phosphate pyrophosphokinase
MTIFVNGLEVKSFNFSAGECHVTVKHVEINGVTNIMAKLHDSNSIMQLLMTVDAVRNINNETKIELTIPYFPYARQDRVCNYGESFSLRVMADLINSLKCSSVTIYDPHSQVTIDMINNSNIISMKDIILSNSMLVQHIQEQNCVLISPDKGAMEKVKDVADEISTEVVCATKVRDVKTGHIKSSTLHGNVSNKDCIILDDICDGGRTFTELAKVLKEKGANNIYLYVTHGIFSKGLNNFSENFKHIYCYHLIGKYIDDEDTMLTVLSDSTSSIG